MRGARIDELEAWIALYQPTIYRAAYLILRDAEAAEDAAQDSFLRAYLAAGRRKPDDVKPWLYRIAVNTSLNILRSRKREAAALARIAAHPAAATEDSETRSVISDAVHKLPERLRLPVILRYYLDMTEKDISRALGVRPGTIKSRLFEARGVLAGDETVLAVVSGGE